MNALAQYLQMYDQNMPARGGAGMNSSSPWVSSQAEAQMRAGDAYNSAGARLNWAEKMAGRDQQMQPHPNFFGGGEAGMGQGYSPTAYVPPQQFRPQMPPESTRYMPDFMHNAYADAMGVERLPPNPNGIGSQVNNFLSQLLKKGAR